MHVDSDEAKSQIATQFQIGAPRILLHPLCLLSSEENFIEQQNASALRRSTRRRLVRP